MDWPVEILIQAGGSDEMQDQSIAECEYLRYVRRNLVLP